MNITHQQDKIEAIKEWNEEIETIKHNSKHYRELRDKVVSRNVDEIKKIEEKIIAEKTKLDKI